MGYADRRPRLALDKWPEAVAVDLARPIEDGPEGFDIISLDVEAPAELFGKRMEAAQHHMALLCQIAPIINPRQNKPGFDIEVLPSKVSAGVEIKRARLYGHTTPYAARLVQAIQVEAMRCVYRSTHGGSLVAGQPSADARRLAIVGA